MTIAETFDSNSRSGVSAVQPCKGLHEQAEAALMSSLPHLPGLDTINPGNKYLETRVRTSTAISCRRYPTIKFRMNDRPLNKGENRCDQGVAWRSRLSLPSESSCQMYGRGNAGTLSGTETLLLQSLPPYTRLSRAFGPKGTEQPSQPKQPTTPMKQNH